MEFWLLWGALGGTLLAAGLVDSTRHRLHLRRIPLRINVNGTRGKSTVTRMIVGVLREAGVRVIGKTTGTAARLIYWDRAEEEPIKRKPSGPNIKEQVWVVHRAAERGAECLVSECMAVNPEYQEIFAKRLLAANLGVIVNTLPDHLDAMGPTTKEAAEALSSTIPRDGAVVLVPDEFHNYYAGIAASRNCRVWTADPDKVPSAFLAHFDYVVFPANIALVLEVARALGIDRETAMRGMLKARPDPGVLTVRPILIGPKEFLFANAFAANDPVSTLLIHERLIRQGYGKYPLVVLVNCRDDRVDRTRQLTEEVLTQLYCTHLLAIGRSTAYVRRGHEYGWLHAKTFLDLQGKKAEEIISCLAALPSGSLIMGIGNIHGAAEELVAKFSAGQESNWQLAWGRNEVAHF